MGSPLIATKLYVPRPRRGLVDRGRLTSRLRVTGHAKLTLVSAPAGFGKTTAVTSWVAASVAEDRVVAWVSLEEGDAQAGTFWTYVVAALHQAIPDVGADLLVTLESGQPPATQLIATLVNEIGAQAVDIDLVLDDYHRADGSEVTEGMAFLLDHLPPNLHVVITTRADPDLPLARLRARGELVEIRARDLRFTEEETAAYVTEVGGVDIERADVATLTDRTEGWAAALQLATLSLQGRDDVTAFVAGFAGDDRYVPTTAFDVLTDGPPPDGGPGTGPIPRPEGRGDPQQPDHRSVRHDGNEESCGPRSGLRATRRRQLPHPKTDRPEIPAIYHARHAPVGP